VCRKTPNSQFPNPQGVIAEGSALALGGLPTRPCSVGRVAGWATYVAGIVCAVASDVPLGAGLSSSAALECATLGALAGDVVPIDEWPRIAQRAENDYVGMPCGIMDQSAATFCRDGHALFLDCRTLAYHHVPFDLQAAGLAILLIDTGAPHRLVTGEYASRRTDCESAARILGVKALRDVSIQDLDAAQTRVGSDVVRRRLRHVVTENQRVLDTVELLRAGRLRDIGHLLTASHASLRDDFEGTVPPLDTAVEAALSSGAYGARMTGGGFGGCVLALIDVEAASDVARTVTASFDRAGLALPATYCVAPSGGVMRHM
jgi:galactokinase